MRRTPAAALAVLVLVTAPPFHAQSPPQFEVAAIRRHTSGDTEGSIGPPPGGRFHARNMSLRFIIQVSHDLPQFRLSGGPGWIDGMAVGAAGASQAPQPPASRALQFDVASVKRNTSNEFGSFVSPQPGGRFVARNAALRHIIQVVYGVPPYALIGGPDWLDSTRYDIEGKAATDAPMAQLYSMARGLLADRFKLSTRSEQRDTPGYALVVARRDGRLGPSLSKLEADCDTQRRAPGTPVIVDGLPPCGRLFSDDRTIGMNGRPLDDFARALSPRVGRPVANRTALDGNYVLRFRWAPELEAAPPGAAVVSEGVSLFTALEEQLGLKLVGERTTMDVVVIEHVERPTEN